MPNGLLVADVLLNWIMDNASTVSCSWTSSRSQRIVVYADVLMHRSESYDEVEAIVTLAQAISVSVVIELHTCVRSSGRTSDGRVFAFDTPAPDYILDPIMEMVPPDRLELVDDS